MVVAILLATRNGAQFLPEQLESYRQQTYQDWFLYASDDASTDNTLKLLSDFKQNHPDLVCLFQGPGMGAARNFLSLLERIPETDYVAFSDQDDWWLPDKIKRSVGKLDQMPQDVPTAYASRVTICDEHLKPLALSPRPSRAPGFRNALIQNILYGHSIVLNRAGIALLQKALQYNPQIVMHDWWIYQMISGVSGNIFFDDESHVLYRQHTQNEIGAGLGADALRSQVRRLNARKQAEWTTTTLASLASVSHLLTEEHRRLLTDLRQARQQGPLSFALTCLRGGLYRQGWGGKIVPFMVALAGRL